MGKSQWHGLQEGLGEAWLDLIQQVAGGMGPAALLERGLGDVAGATGAQWVALMRRDEGWGIVQEWGRLAGSRRIPPPALLSEVCDRMQAGFQQGDGEQPLFAAAPLEARAVSGELLAVAIHDAGAGETVLERLLGCARRLGVALAAARRFERLEQQRQQHESLLAVGRRLSAIRETEPLLERLAEEATALLEADRASIFLWDRSNHELVGRPALGVEGGELRIPDNQGVVGQVVQSGRVVRIDDAYAAPDFSPEVDRKLGYETRNLVCTPLVTPEGQCVGAFEVLNKRVGSFAETDVETLNELSSLAAIALESTQEREQLIRTQQHLAEQAAEGTRIVGVSPAIEALRSTIARVAGTDLPVLILGESGTGKEVVSRAIHFQSDRRDRPLLPVNCAALSESLLESELFGHEKGAFTDAREMRQGKFEVASGGTLFLDEIGDLSAGGQAKLLRVLEEKVVYRVGGSQPIHTDVRVLAATNRDLAAAAAQGKFRQELFFRLSVVTLSLPPLRDRPEDVIPLAEHFLEQFCRDARRKRLKLSSKAKKRLQGHAWPGNVRELRNLMERLAFLCQGPTVEADDLAFILASTGGAAGSGFLGPDAVGASAALPLSEATDRFQQEYIESTIRRSGGHMSEAAKALGLHRSNLYRKMRQLGMETGG